MTKRWLLWSAVSSLPQAKKISNEDQLRLGREAAAKHNGVIVDELVIPGESRSIVLFEDACQRIEAYAKLRQHISSGDFDVLCYYDRSRLGRTAALSMTVVELCRESGIVCYDIESPPNTLDVANSTDDLLIGAIKSVGAQSEVRRLVERRAKGMRGRVLAGKMPAKPNFGYMYDESRRNIIINEFEAAIVRRSLELYLHGRGSDIIVDTINREFACNFYYSKLFRILNKINVYAGYSEFNAFPESGDTRYKAKNYVKAKGNWQPIISEEIANAVLRERKLRNTKSASERQHYIFSGVCWCETCNIKMHAHFVSNTDAKYIRCRDGIEHPRRNVREAVIMDELKSILLKYVSIEDVPEPKDSDNLQRLYNSRNVHKEALQRLEQSRKRADDAYVDGVLSAERYREQIARLTESETNHSEQLESINKQIDYEENRGAYELARRSTMQELVDSLDGDDIQYINFKLRNTIRIYILDGHISRVVNA